MTNTNTNDTTAETYVFTPSEIAINAAIGKIEAFLDKYIVTPMLGKGPALD